MVTALRFTRAVHLLSPLPGPFRKAHSPALPFLDLNAVRPAWNRIGKSSGRPYVSLTFAHPAFGPTKLYANLGRAAGQDGENVLAILRNPQS